VYFSKGRHFSRLLRTSVFALASILVEVVEKLCYAFVWSLLATHSFTVFIRDFPWRTIVPSPELSGSIRNFVGQSLIVPSAEPPPQLQEYSEFFGALGGRASSVSIVTRLATGQLRNWSSTQG
jgi:hypothetical protein